MKTLLLFTLTTFGLYAIDFNQSTNQNSYNIPVLQKELQTLRKENYSLKDSLNQLEILNERINHLDAQINNIDSDTERMNNSITLFGILITSFAMLTTFFIVFLAFKTKNEAVREAKEEVESWIKNDGNMFLVKKIGERVEDYNKLFDSYSSNLVDNDSLYINKSYKGRGEDYLRYMVNNIKLKPIIERSFQDYKKIIFYYILTNDLEKAEEIINSELMKGDYKQQEKALLFYFKGLVKYKNNLFDEAIKCYDDAISLDTSLAIAYATKAKIYNIYEERYSEAIKLSEEAIRKDPNCYDAHISISYAKRNMANEMQKKLPSEKAIDINSDIPLLFQEAITHAEDAIKINPDIPLAYKTIGSIHFLQKHYRIAIAYYQNKVLKKFSTHEEKLTNQWIYIKIFRIYLLEDKLFPTELEQDYIYRYEKGNPEERLSKATSCFKVYAMFKILQKISNNKFKKKEMEIEIENWIEQFNVFDDYSFQTLEGWAKEKEDRVRNNLLYALEKFREHISKSFREKIV